MRIGIAQINTVAGAFDQTVERMVAQSQMAAEQGVELFVEIGPGKILSKFVQKTVDIPVVTVEKKEDIAKLKEMLA